MVDSVVDRWRSRVKEYAPGVVLCATIAAAAAFVADQHGGPVMLLALLLGMAFHFLTENTPCSKGIAYASKGILRAGIVCLGARVTFGEIVSLGGGTFALVVGLVVLTIVVGCALSRILGKQWRFGVLTSGAVAICGASAALAISSVLPASKNGAEQDDRDVSFTVIAVTTLSTVAMIFYPPLFGVFDFTDHQAGFLFGATIHDVAQVVGAGYSVSLEAGDTATIVKLVRVTLLPVLLVVIIAAVHGPGGKSGGRPTFPLFVLGFLGVTAINSFGWLPQVATDVLTDLSRWFLITAVAAIGVKTSLKSLTEMGGGNVVLVVAQTLAMLALGIAGMVWVLP